MTGPFIIIGIAIWIGIGLSLFMAGSENSREIKETSFHAIFWPVLVVIWFIAYVPFRIIRFTIEQFNSVWDN